MLFIRAAFLGKLLRSWRRLCYSDEENQFIAREVSAAVMLQDAFQAWSSAVVDSWIDMVQAEAMAATFDSLPAGGHRDAVSWALQTTIDGLSPRFLLAFIEGK